MLDKNAQLRHMRSTKHVNPKLGKKALNIEFDWVEFMSKGYFDVIDAINSLTAIDGHDRQYFYELRSTVVSRRIFIRSQSLIAR